MLQTRNLGCDALSLERRIDDAQGNPTEPVPVGSFVHLLRLIWGQVDKLDSVGPDDGVIAEVDEIRNLPADGRKLFTQRPGGLRGTQCGLQVFDRFGQDQHCVVSWSVRFGGYQRNAHLRPTARWDLRAFHLAASAPPLEEKSNQT